ncbi:hypothetical protein [Halobacteriovorax sp.]|uniref:hypothetical protein n=1 Tax=Halobacteriovorax sp. TaxID=2020862 RepID=UPI0035625975
MKKLLAGIILLTSMSSFASTLECGLFKGLASGTPIKKALANLDDENIYVYETNQEEQVSLSIVSQKGNFVRVRISQPEDYNEVILDKGMLLSMEERKSFGLVINGAKEGKMSAVCYKGNAPF